MTATPLAAGAGAGVGVALSRDAALAYPGTLLARDGTLVAPYDLEHGSEWAAEYLPAAPALGLLHAAQRPFRLDYARTADVHVINGMGVALGDSVIGLSALAALRARHPQLRFTVYRPARAPRYVDALYALAADVVAVPRTLPCAADALPAHTRCIDLGNHLYWPAFAREPMIDFFLAALGTDPAAVPAATSATAGSRSCRCLRCRPHGGGPTCCSVRPRAPQYAACRRRCVPRSSTCSRSVTGCRWPGSGRSRIPHTST